MKNIFIWLGIALFIFGGLIMSASEDIGAVCAVGGIVVFIIGIIKLIKGIVRDVTKHVSQPEPEPETQAPDAQAQVNTSDYFDILNLPKLAPDEMNGEKLVYSYTDVTLYPAPEFMLGGDAVKRLGIKRGDGLQITNAPKDEDPDNIAVFWNNYKIGDMRQNRMRQMAMKWFASDLPIFAAVAYPRENNEIIVEFGFYGKPGAKR